ncbi:hypothetical protein CHARACLAT_012015 [Characodon lateralis]|uniref:C2H2-type domain-containing protein n=1 Tax=Characodon lateralis TaxID=208331 RepID=A0ABU7E331_9TELE|nr:hypothetical protein [Characodon lateralis]
MNKEAKRSDTENKMSSLEDSKSCRSPDVPEEEGEERCSSKQRNSEEKPQCEQCGRRFANAWNLKQHQQIHTGEKPNICSYCSNGFSTLSNVKAHQRGEALQL